MTDDQNRPLPQLPPTPFALPSLPPPEPVAQPVEVLRFIVVLKRNGRQDFLAGVERDDEIGERIAGCRAADPAAALQGAAAAAIEVLRAGLRAAPDGR